MTEKAVRSAVCGVLDAATCHPLTLDEVKGHTAPMPDYYNEVTVVDIFGGENRLDSFIGTRPYRILVRSVGKTEDAGLEMRARGRLALVGVYLAVSGDTSTPVLFESADPISEDEGWFTGLMTLTCTV